MLKVNVSLQPYNEIDRRTDGRLAVAKLCAKFINNNALFIAPRSIGLVTVQRLQRTAVRNNSNVIGII